MMLEKVVDRPAERQKVSLPHADAVSLNQQVHSYDDWHEAAPASKLARFESVTVEGARDFLPGVKHAVVDHFPQLVGNAVLSVGMGAAAKILLPETGPLGKVLAAGLGLYFAEQAARPIVHAYSIGLNAKNMGDIHSAAEQLGDTAGSLAVNVPIGYFGYNLGARAGALAETALSKNPAMSGFLTEKEAFYDGVNQKISTAVDSAAAHLKNLLGAGEGKFTGSHAVVEKYPRMPSALKRTIEGEDYALPTVKLAKGSGDGVNVIVETGHGVEAPEFTEVVRALKDSGANVKVATPDWMWQYQEPGLKGKFSLARWQDNSHMASADLSNSQALSLLKEGKVDAVYVPGGAGNTAALRTDGGAQELIRTAAGMGKDVWTICHGPQVIKSSHAFPAETKITGSGDILEDLSDGRFAVDRVSPVVWDESHHLLSGQDPHALNPFISALGARLAQLKAMIEAPAKS